MSNTRLFLQGMSGEHEGSRFPIVEIVRDTGGGHKLVVADDDGNQVTLTRRNDGTMRVRGSLEFALGKQIGERSGLVDSSLAFLEN